MRKKDEGRRGNGEGTIRQRPDSLWEARFRSSDGKQHSCYGKTRAEARANMQVAQRLQASGIDLAASRQTLDTFLDTWLADVKQRLKPKTYRFYEQVVRCHLKPGLGRHRLQSLGPQQVQTFLNRQAELGLSAQTIHHHRAVLRCALEQAVRWRLVERNVAKLTNPPRLARKPVQPLSVEQARRLLEVCQRDRLGPLFELAITTGMRQGELFGLRWDDVDLVNHAITVRYALQRIDGEPTFVEPKSHRSRRTIPLPAIAIAALERQRILLEENRRAAGTTWQDWSLVFTSMRGTPLDGSNVNARLHTLLEQAGLPRQRFHDLRHCSASLLLHGGVGMRTIMGRLGHSQVSLTMNTYAHLSPELERSAAAALDQILST